MEIKKNPKSNLENYSKLFMLIGLVLALFITYVAMENKTYQKKAAQLGAANMSNDIDEETLVIQKTAPPPPPAKAPPPPPPVKIEKVEDDKEVEETVIETTETDESEAVEVEEIQEAGDDEPEIVEDVPFAIIEEVPVYPGCKGTKQQKTECLNKELQKFIRRNFNADLANELGLSPGRKRIYLIFKIDKDGSITDINARAPHPRLKEEAIRLGKKLPKMQPGKQRGKPVRVGYTLPITFNVE
ncbi:energy transducer TonB [Tenacibaculum sp. UWU-22]|uniref:energy transducer TonB n=1 Tax=Tenacibaculum sp. UWU-22 TaxID=3234187 RepID=UPI0034DB027F